MEGRGELPEGCVRRPVLRGSGCLSFPGAPAEPRWGEGVAGNGASLAPATSNPRLACEHNGCLIFSIRRAQCRILSFTRGGASEVISPRHSARTPWLCGGAGISRGPGCAAAATSKGPGGPGGCGNRRRLPREPPRRLDPGPLRRGPAGSPRPGPAALPALPGTARPQLPRPPRPLPRSRFQRDLKCFFPLSPGSQRARRGRSRGDGSVTQSADPGGVQQMVPLTPAAERAALRASGLGALTPPATRMPELGPRGGWAPAGSSARPAARSTPPGTGVRRPGPGSSRRARGAGPGIRPCLMLEPQGRGGIFENLPDQGFPILAVHRKHLPEL